MQMMTKSSSLPLGGAGVLLAIVLSCTAVQAQDAIMLANGQRREGKILGVSNNTISIQAGRAEVKLPLSQIRSVEMAEPPEIAAAAAAQSSGDAAKALQILKPVAENFRGLPTAWARQASATLGDLYLQTNQMPQAEAAFNAFQQAYPDAKNLAALGLAQLAVAKEEYAEAKPLLEPIVAEALNRKYAENDEGFAFGRALYLMGRIQEAEGNYTNALSNYLTTVTIYYQDPNAVAQAQDRADALRKEKKINVP